jgi:hypothetical protein
MANIKWLEPGTAATGDTSLFSSVSGTAMTQLRPHIQGPDVLTHLSEHSVTARPASLQMPAGARRFTSRCPITRLLTRRCLLFSSSGNSARCGWGVDTSGQPGASSGTGTINKAGTVVVSSGNRQPSAVRCRMFGNAGSGRLQPLRGAPHAQPTFPADSASGVRGLTER